MMRFRSFDTLLVSTVIVLCCITQVAQGTPYFVLTNTRAKCVAVLAPQDQTVTISYHAPDIQISEEEEEIEKMEAEKKMEDAKREGIIGGVDTEWNRRLQEKLERMKNKKMHDISITVSQSTVYGGGERVGTRSRVSENHVSGRGRIRENLSRREGAITFLTKEYDGKVDICMQSIIASSKGPSRISIDVTMEPTLDSEDSSSGAGGGSSPGKLGSAAAGEGGDGNLASDQVKTQMGRFERDLATLKSRVKHVIGNADFNKEQSIDFHEQSVAMNNAATYWPIIRLTVIVIAGFTQANHIVSYMKARHIV